MLSRTADHLFWMARYMERAENTARMLDVNYQMSLLPQSEGAAERGWRGLLSISELTGDFAKRHGEVTPRSVMDYMVSDAANGSSIRSCLMAARENARAVRGSITSEMWEVLNSTWLEMQQMDEEKLEAHGISMFFDWVKERSHLFRGVTFGTMHRDDAYDFARMGTHMERADSTARILDVKYHILLPSVKDVGGAVDYYQWSAVLRSVSAFEAYRKVYRDVITPLKLAELLILRDDIPRSLSFCLKQVCDSLGRVRNAQSDETIRSADLIHTGLREGRISEIFAGGLHEYLTEFLESMHALSQDIQANFFSSRTVE